MIAIAVCLGLLAMAIVGFVAYQVGKEQGRVDAQVKQRATGGVHMSNIRANGDVIATVEVLNSAEVDQ